MPASPKIPSFRPLKPFAQAVVRLEGLDRYLGRRGTPATLRALAGPVGDGLS